MAFSPAKKFDAKIVGGISALRNAVLLISGVAGKAKVIIKDDWSSFQVVSENEQQSIGDFLVELRLRRTGFLHYDFEADGDEHGVCNYGIVDNLAGFRELLKEARDEDGFYITYNPSPSLRLALLDNPDPMNADPLKITEKLQQLDVGEPKEIMVIQGRASTSSSSSSCEKDKKKEKQEETYSDQQPHQPSSSVLGEGSTAASSSTATVEKSSIELALNPPTGTGLNDPPAPIPMADENGYRVTVTIPSDTFLSIIKELTDIEARKRTQVDTLTQTVPGAEEVLRFTIIRTAFRISIYVHRSRKCYSYEGSAKLKPLEFQVQGAGDDGRFSLDFPIIDKHFPVKDFGDGGSKILGATADDKFDVEFPFGNLNLKALWKEASHVPGTGSVEIRVGHPQGCNPLLKFPVGPQGQLGNLFFSGRLSVWN